MLCNAVPQRGYMSCSRYGTLGNTVPVMLAEQIVWSAMLDGEDTLLVIPNLLHSVQRWEGVTGFMHHFFSDTKP